MFLRKIPKKKETEKLICGITMTAHNTNETVRNHVAYTGQLPSSFLPVSVDIWAKFMQQAHKINMFVIFVLTHKG